ncbi:MAG: DUF3153 domain-containing protein [Cyanobacteria bacterium SID2]|nr:DUF3153 domain-containing protein [Cyanobacteria bacterium SID2]MBP0002449.1 DUF3153 domain-containing protein [Cyanobacteria bacterium SBC]
MNSVTSQPPTADRSPFSWFQRLRRSIARYRTLAMVAVLAVMLSGCVRYDVGIHFDSQTHGEIVQHVNLSKRFANLSSVTVQEWLDSLDRRARSLRGYTTRQGAREAVVVIPFNNGEELVSKFNKFFNPIDNRAVAPEMAGEIPQLATHLAIEQRNFVFAIYNHLSLDVDLQALGVLSTEGNVLVSPGGLLDLAFRLDTPWGVSIDPELTGLSLPRETSETSSVWTLEPGAVQHIETSFWVPSPIGIGAAVILAVVSMGWYLKHQLLPKLGIGRS